ncbi:AAA domain-containing protein [Ornithinibacillus caprae]|uniref:AAA domain-containing protein n=1 Tax=Ornithinibacillus caprae TaxID=2678566 RepID=UPI0018C6F550|nr:AAA domain-containing protein [Ornithinibacillus caprae]
MIVKYKQQIKLGKIKFSNKLQNLFVYGIYNFKIYNSLPELVITHLQKKYYDLKSKELKDEIAFLDNKLENYNFESAMKEYRDQSMRLFKASLGKRFGRGGSRTTFNTNSLWKDFDRFIKEYPVILSTTHSLRNCAANNYLFDYVLVDEASQVDIVTGALALSCAKNAVIVGDEKQLPNVVPDEVRGKTTKVFNAFQLDEA